MIEQLSSLSIEKKVGQLFFIGLPGPDFDGATRELLDEVSPGGVCLFARNIRERSQTRNLLEGIRTLVPVTPFLSADQEGGLVDRLRRILSPMPAANRINSKAESKRLAELISESLGILGFNMDFAPVVDVVDAKRMQYANGLYSRAFGQSKEDVVEIAGEFLEVLQNHGVIGCAKHFPGLGAAEVDSHEELPSVGILEAELNEVDLFPYRELLAKNVVHAIMVAHASFPNHHLQDADQNGKLLPSSLSYSFVTTLLRDELRFDGLVITDDLEMGAIINSYGIGDACKMAVVAGVDMLAICADHKAIVDGHKAVLQAVKSGEISEDRLDKSIDRIARTKGFLSPPLVFNPQRLDQITIEIADFGHALKQ